MKRILLFTVLAVFIFLYLNGEIKYKVSGRVLQNSEYVDNFSVRVVGKNNNIRETLTPDKNGKYSIYLPNGEYYISCSFISVPKIEEKFFVHTIGPDNIYVQSKNIDRLDFNIYKDSEIIEKNIDILRSIPQTTPTVNYHWGKIPLIPEVECRAFAESNKDEILDQMPDDIQTKLKLGNPIICYDFKNNPIFYEYPIVYTKLNVEVGCFGVEALGLKAKYGRKTLVMEIESKDDPDLKKFKDVPITTNSLIPRVIENLAQERSINKTDIVLDKLVYYFGHTNILLRIKSTKELVLVNSSSLRMRSIDNESLIFRQKVIETFSTLQYIIDVKRTMNKPLM